MNNNSKRFSDVVNLFFLIAISLVVLFVVQLIIVISIKTPHTILNSGVFHQDINDSFRDFYNINDFFLNRSPYIENQSSYPPLNFIICWPFMLLQKHGEILALVFYIVVYSLLLALIVFLIVKKYKFNWLLMTKLLVVFLISTPVLFIIERANYLIITFEFLCLFLLTYNSKNRVVRELSFVWLAIAAATKLYPAVFAIILIREKRWLDFLKTVGYSALLFFVPFLVLKEGFIANIQAFLKNLLVFSEYDRLTIDVSTTNLIKIIGYLFGVDYQAKSLIIIANAIKYPLFVLMIGGMIFAEKKWYVVALAALCSVIVPTPVKTNSLIIVLIPLFFFLIEEKRNRIDYFYMALFLIIITPLQLGYIIKPVPFSEQYPGIQDDIPNYLGLSVNVFLEALACFLLSATLSIEIAVNTIKKYTKRSK